MKTIVTPVRREEIVALADYYRKKYKGLSIDEVALREDILLVRMPDENVSARGYATAFPKGERRKRIASLTRPGEYIISQCEWETLWQDCIVINTAPQTAPPLNLPHIGGGDLGSSALRDEDLIPSPSANVEGDRFDTKYQKQGVAHPASEAFVFWHEFYHLGYSPTRNTAKFFHSFSTTGILDAQEERRANEFAGLMCGEGNYGC